MSRLVWMAVVLGGALLTACGGEMETSELTGVTSGAGTPTPTAVATPLGGSSTPVIATATPLTRANARTPTPAPTDSDSIDSSQSALSFSDLWERRDELIGDEVLVEGKVLFTLECPPQPEFPRDAACIATAHLVAKDTTDLLPHDDRPAVVLQENGATVSCVTQQVVFLDCGGWMHERKYLVKGVLGHLVVDGKPTETLALEVLGKQEL